MRRINDIFLSPNSTIQEALGVIDSGAVKVALVVDEDERLLGTLCDGDVRRGLLNKRALTDTIKGVYFDAPVVSKNGESEEDLLYLCAVNKISQIPILDKNGRVVDLFSLDKNLLKKQRDNTVVLMVGGLGSRLRPLTENTPKPMLSIGGKPILQTIVEGLVQNGFSNIVMCLGYKSDVIRDYFKNGEEFKANIQYVTEEKRMGTAGALTLLDRRLEGPIFVMNGDILTSINYEQMLDFHKENDSKATMCVREYDIEVPYGVVSMANNRISSIDEKPVHKFFVNAGIYILEPECIDLIPLGEFYDMTSLFDNLVSKGENVSPFPLKEYWLDIGRLDDYKQAKIDYLNFFNVQK